MIKQAIYKSPVGNVLIKAEGPILIEVKFYAGEIDRNDSSRVIDDCIKQLKEYFNKKRTDFNLPLFITGTGFQKDVWNAVSRIPFGKTASYKDIGISLDNLGAIRAIGKANGDNKFHIIIPCHRIIGTNGSLTGYAGGLEVKKKLLIHEEALSDNQLAFSFEK